MKRSTGWAPIPAALAACLCLHALVVLADPDGQSEEITLERKQIFVNIPGGPSFSLMVEPDETGVDLKRDIYELEGIPDSPMIPKLGDTVVEHTKRLSDYNILDQTILTVDIYDHRSNESVGFLVKTLDGRELQVTALLGDSVASLKDNITHWTGIPQLAQRILCNGKELRSERKLLHYRIDFETILILGRPLEECRQVVTIYVKTLSGATLEVEVNLADTVDDLKEKIWEKAGVPVGVQRLSADERMITGEDHLCDLGLAARSNVYMYLYSARITSLDQVTRLQGPPAARPVQSPYKAPIFREVVDVGQEGVQDGGRRTASLYKDARNWVARDGHRPFLANDMFDQVAHLTPNPDFDSSMRSTQELLETSFRPDAGERDRLDAVHLARIKLSSAVWPYRVAANLTSVNYTKHSPGITLGGGSTGVSSKQLVPLGADVNNWAPDAFSDSEVMRLFEVAERVRRVLARAARTGEGILSIASQRRINREILFTYHEALAGYTQAVVYDQSREDEECGICRDELAVEPAVKLACGHAFHADCIVPWATDSIQTHGTPNCPSCRQRFTLAYETLAKAELEMPELQANGDE